MNLDDLTPRRRAALWAAIVSGLLLSMLDQTIVGTAMPAIVGDLGGPGWYVWAFTAYLVPATVLLPVSARLSDRFGRRRLLLTGMAAFVTGSLLCAAAPTMGVLVGGRAVQGAGAAALEALTFIVVSELSAGRRGAAAQAALAGVMAFAFVAGPLIGGLLADHAGWRWAFLVNVPVGVAAIAAIAVTLPASFGRSESRTAPVDVLGIATLSAAIGVLLVGVGQHQEVSDWTAPRTGGLVLAGLAGLVVFGLVERRAEAPVIPLRLLTDRVTARLLLAGATATTGLYAAILLVPRWYQEHQGVSATWSGVRMYPLLVGLLLAVNVGAALAARRGSVRGVLLASSALAVVAAAGLATLGADSPAWWPLVLLALLGVGMGPALSVLQLAIARSSAPADLGAAMGTLLLGRQVVGTVALAAGEALYVARVSSGPGEATGGAVAIVAGAGSVLAAAALVGLRLRLPAQPVAPAPAAAPAAEVQPAGHRRQL